MTVVFVHGVPNTAAVWDPVRSLLPDRDTIAVQLPGFGRDAPAGFSGTRYAYRDWLIDQLETMNEPVDLVGHDQGSVISQGVILARPDLVNTWVLGGGVCADDFLWHRQARIWQTTGLGEDWRDQFLGLDVEPALPCWRPLEYPRPTPPASRQEWTAGCSITYCRCTGRSHTSKTGRSIRPQNTRRAWCCGAAKIDTRQRNSDAPPPQLLGRASTNSRVVTGGRSSGPKRSPPN